MPDSRWRRYTRTMKNQSFGQDLLPVRLKQLVVDLFRLDILEPANITDDETLFGGSLGLDSFDAVELALCIEEEFGIAICGREMSHSAFASIASLADFIHASTQPGRECLDILVAVRTTSQVRMLPSPG